MSLDPFLRCALVWAATFVQFARGNQLFLLQSLSERKKQSKTRNKDPCMQADFPIILKFFFLCRNTVPPGTIYPFAAVFSRSIRGAMPRFHLDNDAACRKIFAVLPNFTAACDSAVNSVPR